MSLHLSALLPVADKGVRFRDEPVDDVADSLSCLWNSPLIGLRGGGVRLVEAMAAYSGVENPFEEEICSGDVVRP